MVNLQKNPATFLPLFFTEWAKPTNFSYLVMVAIIFTLDFLPFSVLTLMWIEWGRMKIVNMSQSCCENFLTIFWFAVYETHRGFHCFKKVFLELFSLPFFIKWWNSTKPFFFCMSKQYFCQKNFLTEIYTTEIYLIYWNVLLWRISSHCLAFDKNPTKYYVQLPQLVLLLATTRRPNLWVLRKIWLSECLPFENHFFLIINQKVGYPAIYIYTVYFPKLLLS